jgi:hypothetical protein
MRLARRVVCEQFYAKKNQHAVSAFRFLAFRFLFLPARQNRLKMRRRFFAFRLAS